MLRTVVLLMLIAVAAGCESTLSTGRDPAAPLPAANTEPQGDVASPSPATATAPDARSATAHHADARAARPELDPMKASAEAPSAAVDPSTAAAATVREITIPVGTRLRLRLESDVSSAGSRVEDPVRAVVQRPIVIDGVTVVPAGSAVTGHVTDAQRSGRVKGRARIAVRFDALRVGDRRYTIRTASVTRQAPATKGEDAQKIGIGASAGAVVGAISGGKKGAAIGTTVGAAGGTAAVLATRGKEVSIGRGTVVNTRLASPLIVRVH